MSVRNYAILWPKSRTGSTQTVSGGNQLISTGQHALDGAEHTGQLPETRLSTTETDTALVLHPDGLGGVEWDTDATGGAGSAMYPTVLDYGAVGDGTTDDTAAIQDALDDLDEYDTLYFPKVTVGGPTIYKITAALDIAKAVRLLGFSAYPNPDTTPDGAVVIRQATNNTSAIVQSATKRLDLENIVIDNAGTNASGRGIYVLGSVAMRHVLVRDFYDNLFIDGQTGGSYNTVIDESFFHNAGRANIYLDDKINHCLIRGGFISTGPYGILASGGIYGLAVDGTAIESYNTAGIYLDGTGPGSGQQTSSVLLANLTMDVVVAGTQPDIWIGANTPVENVTILNPWIEPGNASQVHVKLNKVDRVTMIGGRIKSNVGGSTSVQTTANTTFLTVVNVKADGSNTFQADTRDLTALDVTPVALAASASAGTSTYVARADHVHPTTGLSSGGSGSTPLLASDHATPFTFDEMIQSSDGTEFIFASE